MNNESTAVGRVKTALVFDQGESGVAVIAGIVAQIRSKPSRKRLSITGPAVFSPEVIQHLNETVLAVVDRITSELESDPKSYELSVVNLGAASASGVGLKISGFSADAAVMTALLSAALELPIPQPLAMTGHVASTTGDIRAVESLPSKLKAALDDPDTRLFVYPSATADASMKTFTPKEAMDIEEAVTDAKCRIQTTGVKDVCDLIQAVFSEEAMVTAGLHAGFFDMETNSRSRNTPVERAAFHLARENEKRFWRVLESHLLSGRCSEAKDLMVTRVGFQCRRKRYPEGIGRKLLHLVLSLPPAVRRLKTLFPLLSMEHCLDLARFSGKDDHEDVAILFDAAPGKSIARKAEERKSSVGITNSTEASAAVDTVLDMISADSLSRKFGLPIDAARAAYAIGEVVLESYEDFLDTVTAFYLHLIRHTNSITTLVDMDEAASEAYDLLDRAFRNKGGADVAWAEARHGTKGGLRFIIDVMTEQFKTEQQAKHVNRVFKETADPLDWKAREAFMEAFLARIESHLPEEIRNQPAERYTRHYEPIVRIYVQSMDQVREKLRNL